MKCSEPYVIGGQAHACSRCLACLSNRRRLWASRIMLESRLHSSNAFLTLTYSDSELPLTPKGTPTLSPKNLQDFLKRLRRRIEPLKFRYFAVGEYGEKDSRPHYHLATFGAFRCSFGKSRYSKIHPTCCRSCEMVRESWGHGNIFAGELTPASAAYVCGYVVKKMTGSGDSRLLDGQHPEFARMSLRPGIGCGITDEIASSLLANEFDGDDVPNVVRNCQTGSMLPLGRYLRQQLRIRIGREKCCPPVVVERMKNEMQPLREFAFDHSRSLSSVVKEVFAPETARLELLDEFYRKGKKL